MSRSCLPLVVLLAACAVCAQGLHIADDSGKAKLGDDDTFIPMIGPNLDEDSPEEDNINPYTGTFDYDNSDSTSNVEMRHALSRSSEVERAAEKEGLSAKSAASESKASASTVSSALSEVTAMSKLIHTGKENVLNSIKKASAAKKKFVAMKAQAAALRDQVAAAQEGADGSWCSAEHMLDTFVKKHKMEAAKSAGAKQNIAKAAQSAKDFAEAFQKVQEVYTLKTQKAMDAARDAFKEQEEQEQARGKAAAQSEESRGQLSSEGPEAMAREGLYKEATRADEDLDALNRLEKEVIEEVRYIMDGDDTQSVCGHFGKESKSSEKSE